MKLVINLLLFALAFVLPCHAQQIKGTYAIKNVKTGMLLRIKDANARNGTPLVAYTPQNWKCMTWDFQPTAENTYQLKNLFTKKTFQFFGEAQDQAPLEEQPLTTGANQQQYEFIKVKDSTYLIRLKDTQLYLSPADPKGSINSAIILSRKKDSPLQQWIIYLQHPTM